MDKGNCEFRGTGGQYAVAVFIHLFILGAITVGLYTPWAWVRIFRLKASHTTINKKTVSFTGTGGQLFVLILLQGLLTILTFGLYGPWAICKFCNWRAQNTLVGGKPGQFTGTGARLFLFYLIHLVFLPILTFGIYSIYGAYRWYAWREEHTLYGGERTSFGGRFRSFLGISIVSLVVCLLTLNLFTPWALCMFYRWQVSGLAVGEGEAVVHYPPIKTNLVALVIMILVGLLLLLAVAFLIKNQLDRFGGGLRSPSIVAQRIPKGLPQREAFRVRSPKPSPPPEPAASDTTGSAGEGDAQLARLDALIKERGPEAKLFNEKGLRRLEMGDLEQAEKDLTQAILMDKRHADAHYNRGVLYVRMEKYDLAVRDFSVAIKLDPNAFDALCNRGNAYFRLGQSDMAIQDYSRALALAPSDPDLYYNRGLVRIAKGQDGRGLEDIKRAASLGHERARDYFKKKTPPGRG